MSEWRYIAQRLPSGDFIHWDVPLTDVSITQTLTGPGRISGTIPIEIASMQDENGRPLLEPWGSAIIAEADGEIRAFGIVAQVDYDGSSAQIDCVGIAGYPQGQPWLAEPWKGIQVDPQYIFRQVWIHLQNYPDGDLGVAVDTVNTPVRIGEPLHWEHEDGRSTPVKPKVDADGNLPEGWREVEAEPVELNWWDTQDLGQVIDTLATDTPFDYLEHSAWDGDSERIKHRIQVGYPAIGVRREDQRFVIGENVTLIPSVSVEGEDFASEVFILGSGESRDMVHAHLTKPTNRLRRVAVVPDKAAQTKEAATRSARSELEWRIGSEEFSSITVRDHPNAELGSIRPGNIIRLQGDTGWMSIDQWVKIVDVTISPESLNIAELSVVPA